MLRAAVREYQARRDRADPLVARGVEQRPQRAWLERDIGIRAHEPIALGPLRDQVDGAPEPDVLGRLDDRRPRRLRARGRGRAVGGAVVNNPHLGIAGGDVRLERAQATDQ